MAVFRGKVAIVGIGETAFEKDSGKNEDKKYLYLDQQNS